MITPTTFEGLTSYNLFLSPVPGFAKTSDHPLVGRWLTALVSTPPEKFPELIFAADSREEAKEYLQELKQECFRRYGHEPLGCATQPYLVRWLEDVNREFVDLMTTVNIPAGWRYNLTPTRLGALSATFQGHEQVLILQPQPNGRYSVFDALWDINRGGMKVLTDANSTFELAVARLDQYLQGKLKTEPMPLPKRSRAYA